MQEYKIKVINFIEELLLNIQAKMLIRKNITGLKETAKELKAVISILREENITDEIIKQSNSRLEIILPRLPISNKEKMLVFLDLIKPAYCLHDANDSLTFVDLKNGIKINIEEIKGFWVQAKNMAEFEELMCQKYPGKKDLIMNNLIKAKKSGVRLNKAYRTLKEMVEEENRRPVKDSLPQIREAISTILKNKELADLLMKELEKVSKLKSSKPKYQSPKVTELPSSYSSLNLRITPKKVLSDKEYKSYEEQVKNYYDLLSDLPVRALNILEKIELIRLLRIINIPEEKIANILWNIDIPFGLLETSRPKNPIEGALVLRELRKKALEKEVEKAPAAIEEVYKEYKNSDLEEKDIWKELLKIEIDETNQKNKEKLIQVEKEVHGICQHQYLFWKETLLKAKNYNNGIALYEIIMDMLKNSKSKEEKEEWKQRLIAMYERIYKEQISDNEYEIKRSKELPKRA